MLISELSFHLCCFSNLLIKSRFMAIYREYRMGRNSGPSGFLGPLLILVLFFLFLYYVTKGLFYIFSWLSPVLLLGALILDYKVVTGFLKRLWTLISTQPLFGILATLLAVVAYPFTAAYLFFKALSGKNKAKASGQQGRTQPTYTPWQETTEDIEYEEVESNDPRSHGGLPPQQS